MLKDATRLYFNLLRATCIDDKTDFNVPFSHSWHIDYHNCWAWYTTFLLTVIYDLFCGDKMKDPIQQV